MNKDFESWIESVQNVKAPDSIENKISKLKLKKHRARIIKPSSLAFSSIFIVLLLLINLNDSFYVMAQNTPFETIFNTLRLHDKWILKQYDTGEFIVIDDELFSDISSIDSFLIDDNNVILRIEGYDTNDWNTDIALSINSDKPLFSHYASSELFDDSGAFYVYYSFENSVQAGDLLSIEYENKKYNYGVGSADNIVDNKSLNEKVTFQNNQVNLDSLTIGKAFTTLRFSESSSNDYVLGAIKIRLILEDGEAVESVGTFSIDNLGKSMVFNYGSINERPIAYLEIYYQSWIRKENLIIIFDKTTQNFDKKGALLEVVSYDSPNLVINYLGITDNLPSNIISHSSGVAITQVDEVTQLSFSIPRDSSNFIEFNSSIPDIFSKEITIIKLK